MNWTALKHEVRRRLRRREHQVALRERRRLAHDLHDGLSQDLYATNLELSVLLEQLPHTFQPSVERLIDRQVAMIHSVRELVEAPAEADRNTPVDVLLDDLDQIVRRELDEGVAVAIADRSPTMVPTSLARHARFALREMVSNAVRHSRARAIHAKVELDPDRLTLAVDDDGVGLSTTGRAGIGMNSLRLRARRCGGTFFVTPQFPQGSRARWTASLGTCGV